MNQGLVQFCMIISSSDHRARLRRQHLAGRLPIEALLEDLEASEYWITRARISTINNRNHLQSLFFASRPAIELCRSFPDLLLMDCTYRTNRYQMPLLHIAACSATHHYFSVGFCLLSGEAESDYLWALQQFRDVVRQDIKLPDVILTDDTTVLLWENRPHQIPFPLLNLSIQGLKRSND